MTKLSELIEQLGGDKRVSELLGTVRPRAVKSWRLGDRMPRPAEALRLVELSGGTVRLEDLYSQT